MSFAKGNNPLNPSSEQNLRNRDAGARTVDTFEHALAIDDRRPSQSAVPGNAAAHLKLVSQKHRAIMRNTSMEKSVRSYSEQMQAFVAETAEMAFWNAFQRWLELLYDDIKGSSHVSVKHMITKVAQNGAPDGSFDQSSKQWTQFLVFTDVLTYETLKSSLIVCLWRGSCVKVWRNNRRQSTEPNNHLTYCSPSVDASSFSKSSEDVYYRKYTKSKCNEYVVLDNMPLEPKVQKDCKQRKKELSPSSKSFCSMPTPLHYPTGNQAYHTQSR